MTGLRVFLLSLLLIVSVLAAAAVMMIRAPIEADLAERIDRQLAEAGQSWASAHVEGQTAVIAGTAPTLEAQRLADAAAASVWGVRGVVDASAILPLKANYVFAASRDRDGVSLTGYVPSEDIRLLLKADIGRLFPGVAVDDRTQLARGQPVDFLGLARFALARVAELSEGTATLTGPDLSIEGTALDEDRFAAAAAALTKGMPANIALRTVRILPPKAEAFVWKAVFDGSKVSISGFVPSEAARDAIDAAARAAKPDLALDDQTSLASGGPDGFAAAAVFAVTELPRLAEGTATIDGGVLSLSGKAKSVADHQALLADLGARRDSGEEGVALGALDIVPPFVDPYVWRASRTADRLILAGYVPTEDVRARVSDAAASAFPGVRIDNRLVIAAGDPKMDWIGALSFSLEQLALLSRGSVALEGKRYAIEGEAASIAAFKTLSDQLAKTLPAGMDLESEAVAPARVSPFTFSLARTEKSLTLGGFVPDEAATAAILAAAKPRLPDAEVEIGVERASGAPAAFTDVAVAAVQAVSRLTSGRADLSDQSLTLAGAAVSEDARMAIEAALTAALPKDFTFTSRTIVAVGGAPLSAAECQAALDEALAGREIDFTDDRTIAPESFGFVDRLAAIVQRCPAARIEIGGHTDSAGGAKRNKAISADRAGAVLDYLVADGVRRERLTAVGYGEAKPVTSNGTAEGREKNSRIAFTVESR
jgi:outer membrane protein OmpA-like peptidoglycan-associated protein